MLRETWARAAGRISSRPGLTSQVVESSPFLAKGDSSCFTLDLPRLLRIVDLLRYLVILARLTVRVAFTMAVNLFTSCPFVHALKIVVTTVVDVTFLALPRRLLRLTFPILIVCVLFHRLLEVQRNVTSTTVVTTILRACTNG